MILQDHREGPPSWAEHPLRTGGFEIKLNGEALNGEKLARRATRAWRLRRPPPHIGPSESCDYLNLLALHHARLLSRSGPAAEAACGRAGASGASCTFLSMQCESATVL